MDEREKKSRKSQLREMMLKQRMLTDVKIGMALSIKIATDLSALPIFILTTQASARMRRQRHSREVDSSDV